MKNRYYTVNVTVENEDGELFAVWRSEEPFTDLERAIEEGLKVVQEAPIEFDRMDE